MEGTTTMNDEQREHLERLRQNHIRRLHMLEERTAIYGIDSSPQDRIEIENIKAELALIDRQLCPPVMATRPEASAAQAEPKQAVPDPIDRRRLRDVLMNAFSLDDLVSLCLDIQEALRNDDIDLSVNLDLFGDSKLNKVLGLIEYLDRRNYLVYLVKVVRELRPGRL
jgi:Effector-associated domain 7